MAQQVYDLADKTLWGLHKLGVPVFPSIWDSVKGVFTGPERLQKIGEERDIHGNSLRALAKKRLHGHGSYNMGFGDFIQSRYPGYARYRPMVRNIGRRIASWGIDGGGRLRSAASGIGSFIAGHGRYRARRRPYRRRMYGRGAYTQAGIRHRGPNAPRGRKTGKYANKGPRVNGKIEGVPQFSNSTAKTEGGCRIQHREYIQDIQSSAVFNLQTFYVNPGLVSTFPWLSSIAQNFQQYILHGANFFFRSTAGSAVSSTNNALGTMIMAADYNSADASPWSNKQQMENYVNAMSGPPSIDQCFAVECQKKQTSVDALYIRTGGVPSGQDQRLYDLCQFGIATQGMQTASPFPLVGELWITYDIEMIKPKVVGGAGGNAQALTDHFQVSTSATSTHYLSVDTGTTVNNPVASSTILGATRGSQYLFPSYIDEGQFMIFYQATGASSTITTAFGISYPTDCNLTPVNILQADNANAISFPGSGATGQTEIGLIAIFKFNGNGYSTLFNTTASSSTGSIFYIGEGTLPGTLSSIDLFVMEIAPTLVTMFERLTKKVETTQDILDNFSKQDVATLFGAFRGQQDEKNFSRYVIQRCYKEQPVLSLTRHTDHDEGVADLLKNMEDERLESKEHKRVRCDYPDSAIDQVVNNINNIDNVIGQPPIPWPPSEHKRMDRGVIVHRPSLPSLPFQKK